MIHELKILPEYFWAIKEGRKNFEVRINDRDYNVGDTLILKEWTRGRFTGASETRTVIYVHKGVGMLDNFVVLGFANPNKVYITNMSQVGHNSVQVSHVNNMTIDMRDRK